jgi:sugar transferase (PEP-CTERM/EpsH1 system associated)
MVDVDSEKWRDYSRRAAPPRSWIYAAEAERLGRYEQTIVRRFPRTIVTTPREAATLVGASDAGALTRVEAVPNGVDLTRFAPERAGDDGARGGARVPRVVFTGAMDYYANVDAAEYFVSDVWPAIRARLPDAQFVVVGSNPTAAVRGLASAPGVTVTGTVPDVRPYVVDATVCVAPLRIARGVQNKILEAMAMGRPVVATREAAAGLSAAAGSDLLVAQGPDALADAVVSVARDAGLGERIGRSGRAFVERHHDWAITLRRFVEIVEGLANS